MALLEDEVTATKMIARHGQAMPHKLQLHAQHFHHRTAFIVMRAGDGVNASVPRTGHSQEVSIVSQYAQTSFDDELLHAGAFANIEGALAMHRIALLPHRRKKLIQSGFIL